MLSSNTAPMEIPTDGRAPSGLPGAHAWYHLGYAQRHGYDYIHIQPQAIPDHAPQWTKVTALVHVVKHCDLTVFLDSDAFVRNVSMPLEWLFENHWGFGPGQSILMANDPDVFAYNTNTGGYKLHMYVLHGHLSLPPHNLLFLSLIHAGFIVLRNNQVIARMLEVGPCSSCLFSSGWHFRER